MSAPRLKMVGLATAATVLASALAAAALAPAPAPGTSPSVAASGGCPRVVLYFSRGSGQSVAKDARGLDRPGFELYEALAKRYGPANVGSMANPYPAVKITLRTILRKYAASVVRGVESAEQNVADLAALCPRSRLLLGGFSQGADVTRRALAGFDAREQRQIAAVVLFGDPYFKPIEDHVTTTGGFDPKQSGIARLRRWAKVTPIPGSYDGRVFSWCHKRDLVCQGLHGKNGLKSHGTYDRETAPAVSKIAGRLAALAVAPRQWEVVGTCEGGGTCGVAEWSGPGTTGYRRVGAAYEHQRLVIRCQLRGEPVTGANGRTSAIWDELAGGTFVPDYYVDTRGIGTFSGMIPRCTRLRVVGP